MSSDLKKKRTISLFKLCADAQRVLDEVEKDGTTFTIMHGGVAIARMEPIPETSALTGASIKKSGAKAKRPSSGPQSAKGEPPARKSKSLPVKGRRS
jgi:antitoxin (DNA-binding transcriptional repressor) of toxin-antitoxin stability system